MLSTTQSFADMVIMSSAMSSKANDAGIKINTKKPKINSLRQLENPDNYPLKKTWEFSNSISNEFCSMAVKF